MNYTVHKNNSYNIHFIKTDKFKTVTVKVLFRDIAEKEDSTYRDLLVKVLRRSTAAYPTSRLFNIAKQELYALVTKASNSKMGNYIITDFSVSFLNEKYTEKGMNEKSIAFLMDMIFKPNVIDRQFEQKSFELSKAKLEEEVLNLKDEKRRYVIIKLLQNMDEEAPYSFAMYPEIDLIKTCTSEKLYEFYQSFLKKNIVDVFVIGDFDQEQIEKVIQERLQINTLKKPKEDIVYQNQIFRKRIKKVIEKDDVIQGKLALGAKIKDLTPFEREYVFSIFNIIMGNGSDSKFFKIIRERESLCYYIHSIYRKYDDILVITAGINKENVDKTVKLIKKILKQMMDGDFEEKAIETAKIEIFSSLKSIEDNPNSLISYYYFNEIAGTKTIDDRMKEFQKVKKEDVMNVAKKIYFNTLYLLVGGEK